MLVMFPHADFICAQEERRRKKVEEEQRKKEERERKKKEAEERLLKKGPNFVITKRTDAEKAGVGSTIRCLACS